jgi:hypothetical protein
MANETDTPIEQSKREKPFLFAKPTAHDAGLPARVRERLGPDYIPGYSERVMANDLDTSTVLTTDVKEKYNRRDFGTGPGTIPVEFKWVRVSGPTGTDSYSATQDRYEYVKRGYIEVVVENEEDFVKQFKYAGVTGFPPAAHVGADHLVRHRDSALYYVDRVTADRLEQERIEDNKRLLGHNQPGGTVAPSPYDFNEEETITHRLGKQT